MEQLAREMGTVSFDQSTFERILSIRSSTIYTDIVRRLCAGKQRMGPIWTRVLFRYVRHVLLACFITSRNRKESLAHCVIGRMSFDEFEASVKSLVIAWSSDMHEALLYYFSHVRSKLASAIAPVGSAYVSDDVLRFQARACGIPPVWSDDDEALARRHTAQVHDLHKRKSAAAAADAAMRDVVARNQVR